MKLRTCELCGAEYNLDEKSCPACGHGEGADHTLEQTSGDKRRPVSSGGGSTVAGKAKRQQGTGSRIGWGITCCVLGVAVLAGIFYFFKIKNLILIIYYLNIKSKCLEFFNKYSK